jgi:hypothetical protein
MDDPIYLFDNVRNNTYSLISYKVSDIDNNPTTVEKVKKILKTTTYFEDNYKTFRKEVTEDVVAPFCAGVIETLMTSDGQHGGKKAKQIQYKYLSELYKCNDGKLRKAFRIPGKGNTKFVMVKGVATKIADIPKKL